jgi:hypothetical protein
VGAARSSSATIEAPRPDPPDPRDHVVQDVLGRPRRIDKLGSRQSLREYPIPDHLGFQEVGRVLGLARVEDGTGGVEDEQEVRRRQGVAKHRPPEAIHASRPSAWCQAGVVRMAIEEHHPSPELLDPGCRVSTP